VARIIASEEHADTKEVEDAVIGGLLHDVGKLVLMEMPGHDEARAALCKAEEISASAAEKRLLGADHARLGAYLLGIWGLPLGVVDIVAQYEHPSTRAGPRSIAVWAVHAANAVVRAPSPETPLEQLGIDLALSGGLDMHACACRAGLRRSLGPLLQRLPRRERLLLMGEEPAAWRRSPRWAASAPTRTTATLGSERRSTRARGWATLRRSAESATRGPSLRIHQAGD